VWRRRLGPELQPPLPALPGSWRVYPSVSGNDAMQLSPAHLVDARRAR
jgi:hypothetical protein